MSHPTRRRPAAPLFDVLAQAEAVARSQDIIIPTPPIVPDGPLLDSWGRIRSPATLREFRLGLEPGNKGHRYKPNPPSVAECMAILRACPQDMHGRRMYAAIILMWQGALRAFEALALTEQDLDEQTGTINIQHGKGDKAATIKMAAWAWPYLNEWREIRRGLPNPGGPLLCVIYGPTAGGPWGQPHVRVRLKQLAVQAGVTKRMSCHQLRHAFAVQAYQATMPLRAIQLRLRHENIGITDTYLQGLGVGESHEQVYHQAIPMVPATVLLELTR